MRCHRLRPARGVVLFGIVVLLTLAACRPAPSSGPSPMPPPDSARARVQRAAGAMGGAERLRALQSVRLEGYGHEFVLDAFVRADGPKPVQYDRFAELRDVANGRLRRTVTNWLAQEPDGRTLTTVVDGEAAALEFRGVVTRSFPGRPGDLAGARTALALAPERVLLTALDTPGLAARPDTTLYGQLHHHVAFPLDDLTVHVFLNAATDLPTAVETRGARPHDFSWAMWGDVVERTTYYAWTLEPQGLRYPRQWDVARNGMPYLSRMLTALTLDAAAPPDSFAIADDVQAAFAAQPAAAEAPITLGAPNRPIRELRPGVVSVPGSFTVLLVRQDDGLVVVETPRTSAYSEAVLAEAARRFSDVPVKAAVVAADALTQFGGVRPYVARGLPLYGSVLNQGVIERLATAPYAAAPDALAQSPRPLQYRAVPEAMTVGTGMNRLVLVPVPGPNGDRGLLVYLPAYRLLYASSLLLPARFAPAFAGQQAAEIVRAVEQNGLAVDSVFSMFLPATAWREVAGAGTLP